MNKQQSLFRRSVIEANEKIANEVSLFQTNEGRLAWESVCPPEFRQRWDWAKCKADHEKIGMVLGWNHGARGMFIHGATGLCKSRAVWKMLEEPMIKGRSLYHVDGMTFAELSAENFFGNTQGPWIQAMANVDIFFLDDMGKRFTASMIQALFAVVDRRTAAHRPCLITSNQTLAQMEEIVKDATLSAPLRRRIKEFCEPIAL